MAYGILPIIVTISETALESKRDMSYNIIDVRMFTHAHVRACAHMHVHLHVNVHLHVHVQVLRCWLQSEVANNLACVQVQSFIQISHPAKVHDTNSNSNSVPEPQALNPNGTAEEAHPLAGLAQRCVLLHA